MSTGSFSSDQTSRFIVPLVHFLFPSLLPHDVDLIHGLIRKTGHVAEYFVLGILSFRAFRGGSSKIWHLRWTVFVMILVVLFAVTDEIHQSLVASRTASVVDVGIDLVGGILSQIMMRLRPFFVRSFEN